MGKFFCRITDSQVLTRKRVLRSNEHFKNKTNQTAMTKNTEVALKD